jgi:hypothetical protein
MEVAIFNAGAYKWLIEHNVPICNHEKHDGL